MKYATYSLPTDPTPRLGVAHDDRLLDVSAACEVHGFKGAPATMLALVNAGPASWRAIADMLAVEQTTPTGPRWHLLRQVRLHAPIPRPAKNVMCLGLNYASHRQESAPVLGTNTPSEAPVFFTKSVTAVTGPHDAIVWDRAVTEQVDYEIELGVVIGVSGRDIARTHALDHVFGYTVINDVSARDLQFKHGQWFKGKSLDGFCPMGPFVVTADEFGDPQAKTLALRVNGVVKQESNTSHMLFAVDAIIEHLSRGMTLESGDVIATGTPEGVGLARTPPEFLRDGDLIEAEIEGLGTLRNRLVCRR